MKKTVLIKVSSLVLVAVMLFSFVACSSSGGKTTSVGGMTEVETKTPSNIVVATIEETLMVENDDIKVTALSLSADEYYHILNLQIENKTADSVFVYASRTAVNSFVVDEPKMGVTIPANSTANGELKFRHDDVPAGVIADIETRFSYSGSAAVSSKTNRVKIESSAAATYDYSYDESGTVLYDANGIKIICKGFNENGDPIIYLYSNGQLSEGCCVDASDIYINDKLAYSDYYAWVFTNTRNVAVMELKDTDSDGNPIGEIESLKVSFRIYRENMADSRAVQTDLVEIPVK